MSAATALRMRPQVDAKSAAVLEATRDVDGALTVESCAMYSRVLELLKHQNRLAAETIVAEQSHGRHGLSVAMEAARACIAGAVETIYRTACEAPASRFQAVREAQSALAREAMMVIWPKS